MPTIITFFGGSDYYRQAAEKFSASCEEFELDYRLRSLPPGSGWIDYCRRKPEFIATMLKELAAPVFWLDVDSVILRPPLALDGLLCKEVDFAAVPRRPRGQTVAGWTWYVWGLLFNTTQGASILLDTWTRLCQRECGNRSDDSLFQVAWENTKQCLNAGDLPPELGAIGRAGAPLPTGAAIAVRTSGNASRCARSVSAARARQRGRR